MKVAGWLACWTMLASVASAGELTLYEDGGQVATIVHADQKTYALAVPLPGRDLRSPGGAAQKASSS